MLASNVGCSRPNEPVQTTSTCSSIHVTRAETVDGTWRGCCTATLSSISSASSSLKRVTSHRGRPTDAAAVAALLSTATAAHCQLAPAPSAHHRTSSDLSSSCSSKTLVVLTNLMVLCIFDRLSNIACTHEPARQSPTYVRCQLAPAPSAHQKTLYPRAAGCACALDHEDHAICTFFWSLHRLAAQQPVVFVCIA